MNRHDHDEKYIAYLSSLAWTRRRDLILRRDSSLCQNCKYRKATQVHHLTYDRLYKERPSDLVSLCEHCHMGLHESPFERLINNKLHHRLLTDYNRSFYMLKKYLGIRDKRSGIDWLDDNQIKQRKLEQQKALQQQKNRDVDIFAD